MAHYAFLDENNIVTEVITGIDETELIEGLHPEVWYGNFRGQLCKRTSYNTFANVNKNGGVAFRGNFASKGDTYNETLDVFIRPKEFDSWVLNENNYQWEAPIPYPNDGKRYEWNETTQEWIEIN